MSEGLLEVMRQRSDLSLFRSSLLVSVQSCRLASVYGLDCSVVSELYLFCIYPESQPD